MSTLSFKTCFFSNSIMSEILNMTLQSLLYQLLSGRNCSCSAFYDLLQLHSCFLLHCRLSCVTLPTLALFCLQQLVFLVFSQHLLVRTQLLRSNRMDPDADHRFIDGILMFLWKWYINRQLERTYLWTVNHMCGCWDRLCVFVSGLSLFSPSSLDFLEVAAAVENLSIYHLLISICLCGSVIQPGVRRCGV